MQRHAVDTELPKVDAQKEEIEKKEKAAPPATRTDAEAETETTAATDAGSAFAEKQKLTPGAMSLAAAEKILQGSFGDMKKIVPGTVVILADQAACSAKYDEVCMADGIKRPDGSAWAAGDCAKDDAAAGVTTEGFAWKGTVYVNGATTLVTATAHEILHNNVSAEFRSTVGETFNEGITEKLARTALTEAGITVPAVTAYPDEVEIAEKLIDFFGLEVVKAAYFGSALVLIFMFMVKGAGTWDELKTAAEALDKDKVDEALKGKPETE